MISHFFIPDPAIPTDNPGLPIQDEVCPFHLRMSYWAETLQKNRLSEMSKNNERFQFLKYVDSSFDNITVIPPGTGMYSMAVRIVELSNGGYKIRKMFAKESTYSKEIIEF